MVMRTDNQIKQETSTGSNRSNSKNVLFWGSHTFSSLLDPATLTETSSSEPVLLLARLTHLPTLRCRVSRRQHLKSSLIELNDDGIEVVWEYIMITNETSSKTEQLVVSPGHKPNNEQLKLCSNIFFYVLLLFIVLFQNKPFYLLKMVKNLISAHPRSQRKLAFQS